MNIRVVFILLAACSCLGGFVLDVPLGPVEYVIEEVGGYERIRLNQASVITAEPGAPEIPAFLCHFLIAQSQTVREITVVEEVWEEEKGRYTIYPRQKQTSLESTSVFTEPLPDAYNSSTPCPMQPLIAYTCGNIRGYRILQMAVAPLRYFPGQKKLFYLKKLRCEVKTEFCTRGVAPQRQTSLGKELCARFLKRLVTNSDVMDNSAFRPAYYVENNVGDSPPTDLPSLLGPPVDLVIVTPMTQMDAYNHFARFKKLFGINTAVRTLSWVRQHYTGVDDAERIRNFIRDAYEKWGTSFVLLGGDPPALQTRYVWVDRDVIYAGMWLPIATDLYYSDLDGDWNADGDEKFGEVDDSLDLFPDVFVGRLPTSSAEEVFDYLGKVHAYTFPANRSIQTKALFFSSNLDQGWPGLPYAYELADHLPAQFANSFLDETLNNLTLQSLKDSIHSGFGIITGIGHGDVNMICIRYGSPRTYAPIFYFDSLANTPLFSLMTAITCYTNPFQSDCLGEHWVLNPHGGGVAYIGPTSSSEGGLHKDYTVALYDSLFILPVGQSFAFSKIPFITDAQIDSWSRVYQFSISLLGDPTLMLWDTCPNDFNSVTIGPSTLRVGYDTITVNVDPNIPFNIVFHKEGETFLRDSSTAGVLQSCVKTESSGYLKYTVMSDGYVSYIDSLIVSPGEPYLVYDGHSFVPTKRSNNKKIGPGDDLRLYVALCNNGGSPAIQISARLVCSDTLLTMITDTSSFQDIAAGDTGKSLTPFHFFISEHMPDEHSFDFELIVDYSGMNSSDSFQIIGSAPELIHFTQYFNVVNDTVIIFPYIANYGHAEASGVYGIIRAFSDTVVVIDSIVCFPDIGINEIIGSESDVFEVCCANPACDVEFNLRIFDDGLEVINRDVKLQALDAVDSLRAVGDKNSIVLEWCPVLGAVGYRIYRARGYGGPYTFLHNILQPISRYEDISVRPVQDYYYYVVAVDSSMNHGGPSDTVCGKVNHRYAQGWPQTVYSFVFSSPNFGDLDPSYPGLEIVVCGMDGNIYAWHCDGTPVNGTDCRLFQSGVGYVWSSPALGDVNGDGSLEIAFGIMRSTDNIYVISYDHIEKQVSVLPGWPKSLNGGGFVSSPILSDIDEDGDLEIFALTFVPAHLYAFHHDGSGVYEPDGLLEAFDGAVWGTPAIGDINGDGDLDIVCCGRTDTTRLFVWDRYGNYLLPFPIEIDEGQVYSVIVGDITGDENREICFYTGAPAHKINVIDNSGEIVWQHTLPADYIEVCPALGDINNDGCAEVVFGYNNELDEGLIVFDSSGNILTGFPRKGHDAFPPIVVDVDADDVCDVMVGSTEWNIHAYENDGNYTEGFPLKLGNRINSSPAAYDVDLDGFLELMVSCYDYKFHVFDLDSRLIEWPRFHYDPYNSGCYESGYFTAIGDMDVGNSQQFFLRVYPNPFTHMAIINFVLGQSELDSERATLKIYDVAGRLVKDLSDDSEIGALKSPIHWYGDDNIGRRAPSGVYFVKIKKNTQTLIQKVVKIQ